MGACVNTSAYANTSFSAGTNMHYNGYGQYPNSPMQVGSPMSPMHGAHMNPMQGGQMNMLMNHANHTAFHHHNAVMHNTGFGIHGFWSLIHYIFDLLFE